MFYVQHLGDSSNGYSFLFVIKLLASLVKDLGGRMKKPIIILLILPLVLVSAQPPSANIVFYAEKVSYPLPSIPEPVLQGGDKENTEASRPYSDLCHP